MLAWDTHLCVLCISQILLFMCMSDATKWGLIPGCCVTNQGTVVAIENPAANLYGLQYHPEVQHSERGIATLRRFLFDISKVPADWKIENVLDEEMAKIRATVRPIFRLSLHTCA